MNEFWIKSAVAFSDLATSMACSSAVSSLVD